MAVIAFAIVTVALVIGAIHYRHTVIVKQRRESFRRYVNMTEPEQMENLISTSFKVKKDDSNSPFVDIHYNYRLCPHCQSEGCIASGISFKLCPSLRKQLDKELKLNGFSL